MKKIVDWDEVEATEFDPNETCECTRSKIQEIVNYCKTFLKIEQKGSDSSSSCCSTSQCCSGDYDKKSNRDNWNGSERC